MSVCFPVDSMAFLDNYSLRLVLILTFAFTVPSYFPHFDFPQNFCFAAWWNSAGASWWHSHWRENWAGQLGCRGGISVGWISVLHTSEAWKHQLCSLQWAKNLKSQSLSLLDNSHCLLSLFSFSPSYLLTLLHSCALKRAWYVQILQWVLLTLTTDITHLFWQTDNARTLVILKCYSGFSVSWEKRPTLTWS